MTAIIIDLEQERRNRRATPGKLVGDTLAAMLMMNFAIWIIIIRWVTGIF